MGHTVIVKVLFVACLFNQIQAQFIKIINGQYAVCDNGYVSGSINLVGGAWMTSLYGDFLGKSNYGDVNLLAAGGLRLERENSDGSITSATGNNAWHTYYSLSSFNNNKCNQILISSVVDDVTNPLVKEDWKFSLCEGDRFLTFTSNGSTTSSSTEIRSIRHSLYATPISTTAFFDAGVVQILGASKTVTHFGSVNKLSRAYFLGETGSIDIERVSATGGESDQVVLLNADEGVASHRSGLQDILVGNFSGRDAWTQGSTSRDVTTVPATTWTRTWKIAPNNKNFPTLTLPSTSLTNMDSLTGGSDVEAFMLGIYASAVPCLCTYPGEVVKGVQVAQIATTLRHDKTRGYDGTYNYFDPDNFFSLSAILYSGDAYLQEQVRLVIERTGSFIKTDSGQLPHHFVLDEPYYLALSGETQTGPNTFWVKMALRYASVTGNTQWLRDQMPTLRLASSFVFDLIDPQMNLVLAPGSLMIDVFIRNNYTSDSNAMVVGFLQDFASAERLVGNTTRADELESTAVKVSNAMNSKLWAAEETGGDHFITQLNVDGSIRDFVDYDANLIAVANGVTDEDRSRSIQRRVDRGQCSAATGGGAQFVSEKYYGDSDTTDGNIGDSWCSMARIGWFDARGRKRFGSSADLTYFNERILAPVQKDLIANTWMHERYGCDGLQQENRTMYYFEYPSFASMLLREIRYGVELTLDAVQIDPFLVAKDDTTSATSSFEFHAGNVQVSYTQDKVTISTPSVDRNELFMYELKGMHKKAVYEVSIPSSSDCQVKPAFEDLKVISGEDGKLTFKAPRLAPPCALTVSFVV